MSGTRPLRVAERIREVVASLLQTTVKDPHLRMVTITDVRVSGDLQHASVFYTVYGSEKESRDAQRAFIRATPMFRRHIGKNLDLRLTPDLEFILDALPDTARSFEDTLRQARQRDEEIVKMSENKTYSGEEDPYKQ